MVQEIEGLRKDLSPAESECCGAGFLAGGGDIEIAVLYPREDLDITAGKTNWGYKFSFGLFPISAADFKLIAAAMGARIP